MESKKVICVDNSRVEEYLTLNKEYDVISIRNGGVSVKDDKGFKAGYCRYRFKPKESTLEEKIEESKDNVNHPSHYTNGKYECIDILEDITKELSGLEAVCTANAVKYLWRWKLKNGVEDLKKANWYINKLIENLEKNK